MRECEERGEVVGDSGKRSGGRDEEVWEPGN